MANISATAPVKIPHNCLLDIYKLPIIQDWEYYNFAEVENRVRINFFQMVSITHNGQEEWRGETSQQVPGSSEYDWEPKAVINLAVKSWPADTIWWLPSEHLIRRKYFCTKFPDQCQYESTNENHVKEHMEKCEVETEISSQRKYYGKPSTIMDDIVDMGFLPEEFYSYQVDQLATYDIETCEDEDGILRPISIAVGSSMDEPKYFERKSSNPDEYQKMINEFMSYLMDLQKQLEVPQEFEAAVDLIDNVLKKDKFNSDRSKLQSFKTHLEKYKILNCYGFNSSKFDMQCLIAGLATYADANELQKEVLKKTTKYLSVRIGDIVFKDVLNYTSPCSLSKFLKQWNAPDAKGIFPHGKFSCIEEIREQLDFPPKKDFFSVLKQAEVDEEEYNNAKFIYETRKNLPAGDSNKWHNFSDYLKFYNLLDVAPLVTALTNCFSAFFKHFGIDPVLRLSLPSIAFDAMFGMFDQSMPYVATVAAKYDGVRQIYRENVFGGIVNTPHRDIDLMTDTSPHNARFAPNGNPFTCCVFKDVNAMYCWSEDQELPLTSGIRWKKIGNRFQKHQLGHTSMGALQWLYCEENSDRCVDSKGHRHVIQHEYHQGEKRIHDYKVDGYAQIDGVDTVWEFNGCHWHGCLDCNPGLLDEGDAESQKRYFDTQKKYQKLVKEGCKVYVMKECIWKRQLSSHAHIKTKMPRILLQDNESTLLHAIKTGEVFGFAICSVRTPDHLLKKYQDAGFLFPPVVKRQVLTEDLLSPFMKEQMLEQERVLNKVPTLIQTYHGEDLLLMTPVLQFYMEQGMKVFDVKEFIQYIPGRALHPFVEKVVKMRVDATNEGDEPKQLTAKLFANSGYGKCAEDVSKHRNTLIFGGATDIGKYMRKAFFEDYDDIETEDGDVVRELTMRKRKIVDDKPIQIGIAILQWSKLLFYRYMYFMFHHLEPGSFRAVYADTDSMCLGLTKTLPDLPGCSEEQKYRNLFDPLVRPDMRESWEASWKDWMCTTTEATDIRKPGKLKFEFLFRFGRFIALSPKSYYAFNADEYAKENVKSGYKGICHAEGHNLTLDTYINSLYGDENKMVTNRGFKLNPDKRMVYYEQEKRGLNNIFCKYRVDYDRITCHPLSLNGQLL